MHELAKEFPNKTYRELEKYRDADRQQEAGVCVVGEARKDREEMNPKIKELEKALANAFAINESHQKLNGTLQERLTEVEEDNKKLAHEIEDRVHKMRRSGM